MEKGKKIKKTNEEEKKERRKREVAIQTHQNSVKKLKDPDY